MNKYYNRRRYVAASVVSIVFAALDQTASSGTNLGFPSALLLFGSLSFLPLVIGFVLDELGDFKK